MMTWQICDLSVGVNRNIKEKSYTYSRQYDSKKNLTIIGT